MKNSKQILIASVVVLLALGAYQQGKLNADSAVAPAKIGVVNVAEVLENTQQHKAWQEKMKAEQVTVRQEFDKIQDELEALKANLKLRTPGSEDYLSLLEEITQKNALLEAKDKFYQTKVETEMQQWTGKLYEKMLNVAEDVAKSKGLDMVVACEEITFPISSMRDFTLTLKTKKVLYYNSKYDLTAEVLAAMDSAD